MNFGENGQATGAVQRLTAEEDRARRLRNIAIGVALAGMVGLFYLLTIVRLSGGMH
jgi:hypothetical protein